MRGDLVGLLGEALAADIGREEPGDPQDDARAEQRRRHDPAGLPAERRAGRGHGIATERAGFSALPQGTRANRRGVPPTGTIVSGASMLTNLVHAAVQPSGVSGHR